MKQDLVYCEKLGGWFDRESMVTCETLTDGLRAVIAPLDSITRILWGEAGTVHQVEAPAVDYRGCVGGQPQPPRPRFKWVFHLDHPGRVPVVQNIKPHQLIG